MKRAVFTIVAKNYMASALSLKKSVLNYYPDVDFYIILADKWDDKIEDGVLVADSDVVPEIGFMSFIYDVVEFSTSIKPFYFLYFLEKQGYDSVIYLDPDTYVMDSLDELWDELGENSVILTPHIVDINSPSDYHKESHILNRGVYNLGFIGFRSTGESLTFLKWWGQQLVTECIRSDTRFVDQKWAEYIPVFINNFYVNKSKAYNISDWNYHERKLKEENNEFYVLEEDNKWKKIKFFHFSGIKQQSPEKYIESQKAHLDTETKIALKNLVSKYQMVLKDNGYENWSSTDYAYNYFANGERIVMLQRRLARSLYLEKGKSYRNLFSTEEGSFYSYLKKSNMNTGIIKSNNRNDSNNVNAKSINGGKRKARTIIKKIIMSYIMKKGIIKYEKTIFMLRNNSDIDQQWKWIGDKL